jgi:acyl-CoA thioester hydrolase
LYVVAPAGTLAGPGPGDNRAMPRLFVRRITVPAGAIDALGHVNNLEYLRWTQDVATEHSAAQGWPLERYVALGRGWFVRRHEIEYLRPAFVGDALRLVTWVAAFRRSSSPRRYLFYRPDDDAILARAETLWAFVDFATGAPARIPPELAGAFAVVEDDEALAAARAG